MVKNLLSRPLHGLERVARSPSTEVLGYFQSSASPTVGNIACERVFVTD